MSAMTHPYVNLSDYLCERYLDMLLKMFDGVHVAPATSLVALENMYRILEMYRHDTFDDAPHKGVLDLTPGVESPNDETWHVDIKKALDTARLQTCAGPATEAQKQGLVDMLQKALKLLANGKNSAEQQADLVPAQQFFRAMQTTLAQLTMRNSHAVF